MTPRPLVSMLLLPALLATGCVATTSTSRTWYGPQQDWARYGRVESVTEHVQRTEGQPAAGAVAGALIGGLLGNAMSGHVWYDRWGRAHHEGDAGATVAGAIGGAVVGAAASSQPARETRTYEVRVSFEDGAQERFAYAGPPPFQAGDPVVQTAQGLQLSQ